MPIPAPIPIPVTIYSDFICPWCFIGQRKLSLALQALPGIRADISYRPFELNPGTPRDGWTRREYRVAKFGTWARAQVLDAQVAEAGRAVGLAFNYDRVERTPNTTLPHRLMWAAAQDGADPAALARRLFTAYFTEGRDISAPPVLREVAAASGLAPGRVEAVLAGPLGEAEVCGLLRDARDSGIQGVPLFRIGPQTIEGAQPVPVLEAALRGADQLVLQ